jgi:hypothetical protein
MLMDRGGYRQGDYVYFMTPTMSSSWSTGRDYCFSMGGDLAYNGMESWSLRDAIRDASGLDQTWVFWGLHKSNGQWTYVDGSVPTTSEIMWYPGEPGGGNTVGDCCVQTYFNYQSYDLYTQEGSCNGPLYSICQYKC